MIASCFLHGLLRQRLDVLRAQVIAWDKATSINKVRSTITSSLPSRDNWLQIDDRPQLNFDNAAQVQLALLCRLCAHAKHKFPLALSLFALDELALAVEQQTIDDTKSLDAKADVDSLNALISYVLARICRDGIGGACDGHVGPSDREIAAAVTLLDSLDADARAQVAERLGLASQSDAELRRAIAKIGIAPLIATVVNVGGFAVFSAASTLLGSAAGIVGLTLPFGAYLTLSSVLAGLSSVWVAAPLTVGIGMIAVRHADRQLRRGLTPLFVTTSALRSADPLDWSAAASALIGEHRNIAERYRADITARDDITRRFPGLI